MPTAPRLLRIRCLVTLALGFAALAARAATVIDAPVTPNAQPGVAATMQFFHHVSGTYIVSGQQERSWGYPNENAPIENIVRITGKTPGLQGFDFLDYVRPATWYKQTATERAIAWARQGGLVSFCVHMFMDIGSNNGQPQFYTPGSNGRPEGTTFDIRQAVVAGTPENQEFLRKIDLCAEQLKRLRDAGVTVIWRPFHECSGGWFWWGRHGGEPLKAAWRVMFDRYRDVHHLNNLIWCFNPTGNNATEYAANLAAWYPGDEYVDMISIDAYPARSTHPTFAAEYRTLRDFRSGRKPVVMSENGGIPDPAQLFSTGTNAAGWGYFCTWNGFEDFAEQGANSDDFLRAVYGHPRVLNRDQIPSRFAIYGKPVMLDTQLRAVGPGNSLLLTASASVPTTGFQWQRNGHDLATITGDTLSLAGVQPANTGLYTARASGSPVASAPALVAILTTNKVEGSGEEVGPNTRHQNGNIYDQVLLRGVAATITTDHTQNQITRLSFVDVDDDIVQVEMSGPGALSLVLAGSSGPAAPLKYNQNVAYMKGHAGIVIAGATENTHLTIFSVGRSTAVNQALFQPGVTYGGLADLAFVAISSSDGKFGGLRTANARYFAASGYTGVYAPGVAFQGGVYVHDIVASDTAQPVLLLGSAGDVRVTGGSLEQLNGSPVQVSGIAQLKFTAGGDSHGHEIPVGANKATLQQNGVDVTSTLVAYP